MSLAAMRATISRSLASSAVWAVPAVVAFAAGFAVGFEEGLEVGLAAGLVGFLLIVVSPTNVRGMPRDLAAESGRWTDGGWPSEETGSGYRVLHESDFGREQRFSAPFSVMR